MFALFQGRRQCWLFQSLQWRIGELIFNPGSVPVIFLGLSKAQISYYPFVTLNPAMFPGACKIMSKFSIMPEVMSQSLHLSDCSNHPHVTQHVMLLLSRVWLFAMPWTAVCQAPPSMRLPRQESWSGLLLPSPGDLPDPGTEPASPSLAGTGRRIFFYCWATRETQHTWQPLVFFCNFASMVYINMSFTQRVFCWPCQLSPNLSLSPLTLSFPCPCLYYNWKAFK